MIKKIILGIVLILLVAIALLSYIGYRSFNQEAFKNQIVNNITSVTGRALIINGTAQLTWDPLPTMTLTDVSLENIANSPNKNMFHADKIQIQIEWGSLLKSPTRIKSIVLTKPQFLFERVSLSVSNLNFPELFQPVANIAKDTLFGTEKQSTQIDVIHIDEGMVQYINQITKQTYQLTDLNGDIAFGSMSGPFKFNGKGKLLGVPLKLEANMAQHEISKPIDFSVSMLEPDSQVVIDVNGQIIQDNPEKTVSANVSFKAEQLNNLLKKRQLPLLPENENVIAANLTLTMNPSSTILSDCILRIGTEEKSPAIELNLTQQPTKQSQELVFTARDINLDTWQPTLSQIIHQKLLQNIPATTVTGNISDITLNNQAISNFQVAGLYKNQSFEISSLSTVLPGASTIVAKGAISTDPDNVTGNAQIDVNTQSLRDLLQFLKVPNKNFPSNDQLLAKAQFSLSGTWGPDQVSIQIPNFTLDNIPGSFTAIKEKDKEWHLDLTAKGINWNLYFPPQNGGQLTPLPTVIQEGLLSLATTALWDTPIAWDVKMQDIRIRDIELTSLNIKASTQPHNLTLDTSATTTEEESLLLQTSIENFGSKDWKITQNTIQAKGANPAELLHKLGISSDSIWLNNIKQFDLTAQVLGNTADWDIDFKYQTHLFNLAMTGHLADNYWRNTTIDFNHQNAPKFLQDLLSMDPFPRLNGSLALTAQLEENETTQTLTAMNMVLGGMDFEGQASYQPQNQALTLNTHSKHLDIAKLLPEEKNFYLSATGFNGDPFQVDLFKRFSGQFNLTADAVTYRTKQFANVALQASIENNTLTLKSLNANLMDLPDATINIEGTYSWHQKPELNLIGKMENIPVSPQFAMYDTVGLSGGKLNTNWHIITSGDTPLEMARTLSGQGSIALNQPTLIGADISQALNVIDKAIQEKVNESELNTNLTSALQNGTTPIQSFTGDFTIKDGLWQVASGTLTSADSTSSGISVDWDIPTDKTKVKLPLSLNQWSSLPAITYTLVFDKRGVDLTVETNTFVTAIDKEITQQHAAKDAALVEAKKKELENQTLEARQQVQDRLASLQEKVQIAQEKLNLSPDTMAQKEIKQIEMIIQSLPRINESELLKLSEYQYALEQISLAEECLKRVDNILEKNNLNTSKLLSEKKLENVNNLILQMNQMYQKRSTVPLLMELIQNSEKQREIISRAIKQFDKNISPAQIQQVLGIVQTAENKVMKAYEYAQKVYAGRQTSSSNSISRTSSP